MQSKQIKTGTVYAYAENYQWNPRRLSERRADPVVVKEVGVSRSYYPADSWRPAKKNDGILIAFLDDEGNETRTKVVTAARIREEWAVFKPAADERAQRAAEQKRESLARFNAAHDRLDAVIPANYKRPYGIQRTVYGDGSYRTEVRMSLHEVADLLDAVYAKGVTDGREASK